MEPLGFSPVSVKNTMASPKDGKEHGCQADLPGSFTVPVSSSNKIF